MKSISSGGTLRLCMLCNSRSVTALGKAPSMSRKRTDATRLFLHACLMVASRRCKESVVDLPGRPPK